MDSWVDENGFLLQNKFRQWIEGVVNKALNKLDNISPNCYELTVQDPSDNSKETKYKVLKFSQSVCVFQCKPTTLLRASSSTQGG